MRHAHAVTAEFVIDIEHIATSRDIPDRLKFYAACFALVAFASLRLGDARRVAEFWPDSDESAI